MFAVTTKECIHCGQTGTVWWMKKNTESLNRHLNIYAD